MVATVSLRSRLSVGRDHTCRFLSSAAASSSLESSTGRSRVTTSIDADGVAHVELARPEKLNALDLPMFESIAETASSLRENRRVRAVVLSGQGRAFSSGLDIKSIAANKPLASIERLLERPSGYSGDSGIANLAQDAAMLWRDIPAPVIAVLHGVCYGGALQIALGADMRFATPDCQMSIMETKWGLIPDMSASITLRELVRIDVAKELTMTGRVLSGLEAAGVGLVTRCAEDPMEEAKVVAREITARSPDAVAKAKLLFQETWTAPEEHCLNIETKLQRELLPSWNQLAASGRNFGIRMPYSRRKK